LNLEKVGREKLLGEGTANIKASRRGKLNISIWLVGT
jgi:hypothetical protein